MSRRALKVDRKGKLALSEQDIQQQVCDFLTAHGCVVLENRSKKWNALTDYMAGNRKAKGSPDLVVAVPVLSFHGQPIPDARGACWWIETKRPGERQSPAQREWQRRLEAIGHRYLLVSDVSEIIEAWEKI